MNKANIIILLTAVSLAMNAQKALPAEESFQMDIEIRPRAEYKNNYRLSSKENYDAEFYVSQRNRINTTYKRKEFLVHVSLQEIHLWGKDGKRSAIGSINAYEAYIEPVITKNFSLRLGRQAISLDNGRIFSAAPWAQQCRAHEGLRLMYQNKQLKTDFIAATVRPYLTYFNPAYSPVASHTYKLLLVHWLHYKINKQWTLTTINTTDAFENTENNKEWKFRATNGGRLEFSENGLGATISGYYQYGQTPTRKKISSYYLQPEISYKAMDIITFRLGAEISSGSRLLQNDAVLRSFSKLYGVAWKFMGNMNFFTRFPADVNGAGLVNPYLFIIYKAHKKLSVRADGNLFYTQYHLYDNNKNNLSRYLGFENDLSINYKPFKYLDIHYGFSYFIAAKSMEYLEKIESSNAIPVWSYLMVSFNPEILNFKKTIVKSKNKQSK